jgi:hypothetical protein
VVSGIHDDLSNKQVLNLAEDLTTLDINELYKLVRIKQNVLWSSGREGNNICRDKK